MISLVRGTGLLRIAQMLRKLIWSVLVNLDRCDDNLPEESNIVVRKCPTRAGFLYGEAASLQALI